MDLVSGNQLSVKHRECRIEPDCLSIYEFYENILILMLNMVGSHSGLF
ncbi:type II toxin-antitoxin system YafQ family toxin [Lachnoanaerobaculum gingivalis]